MTRLIEFSLSTKSINAALKQVKEIQEDIQRKTIELRRRLAEIGAEEVRVRFTGAEYAGKNDVTVTYEWDNNSATVVAEGQAVAFIEFGSGVARGGGYPGVKPSGVAPIGTYGQKRGSSGRGWVYKGDPGTTGHPIEDKPGLNWTRGNPPAMAMYQAAREMERRFTDVVREVFG